jgi:hypothetical protein
MACLKQEAHAEAHPGHAAVIEAAVSPLVVAAQNGQRTVTTKRRAGTPV